MAHKHPIRALERSYITGTGDIILAGRVQGYLALSVELADGDTFDYAIARTVNGQPVDEFEFGVGTYRTGPARVVRSPTNGSAGAATLVNFTAGPKRIGSVVFPDLGGSGGSGMPTGGSPDKAFYENDKISTQSYTLTTGQNAGTFGPYTVDAGDVITVPAGQTWSIV